MYKIYATNRINDNPHKYTLIYDSQIDDKKYNITKGSITLETNKAGSFTFGVYPQHFYYDDFIPMQTLIKVTKDDNIIFIGRILNTSADYWKNLTITCEGELAFLNDSIVKPYEFSGTPQELLEKFIDNHNRYGNINFKIGKVTVTDPNNYIARSNIEYENTLSNMNSRLINDSLGGYFYITHENNENAPTLNYLSDFENVSTQTIEFGKNLKDYVKTDTGENIATIIIPLGAKQENSDVRLTIADVNDGNIELKNKDAIFKYGFITKIVAFDDVTDANNLKTKGQEYLDNIVNHNITIDLKAIDLHLINKDISSFKLGDYIHVISKPHGFDNTLLCNKQTIDLLKPDNDSVQLGYTYNTLTDTTNATSETANSVQSAVSTVDKIAGKIATINKQLEDTNNTVSEINHKLESKVDKTDLDTVIDTALLKAKESGDFKGDKGDKGDTGENGLDGKDGADGKDGSNGQDGFSPTISVSKTGKVTTITIIDVNGTKTVTILDGEDGSNGAESIVDGGTPES